MVEDTLFLAMSFVEGIRMGQWAQIVQGQSFTTCVRDLLHQLSGAFAYLHSIAYHRDVGPHNIHVGERFGAGKKFTLMDFGCAVRVADWHCDFECLVGDCHYWCPGAWLAEGCTFKCLSRREENLKYKMQFVHHIDHYVLGVAGLELHFALCPGPLTAAQQTWKKLAKAVDELCISPGFHEKVRDAVLPEHRKLVKALRECGGSVALVLADLLDEMRAVDPLVLANGALLPGLAKITPARRASWCDVAAKLATIKCPLSFWVIQPNPPTNGTYGA